MEQALRLHCAVVLDLLNSRKWKNNNHESRRAAPEARSWKHFRVRLIAAPLSSFNLPTAYVVRLESSFRLSPLVRRLPHTKVHSPMPCPRSISSLLTLLPPDPLPLQPQPRAGTTSSAMPPPPPPRSPVERAMRLLCPFVRPGPRKEDAEARHDPEARGTSWPSLHLPANAHGWSVPLRRPCTFLYALLVGTLAAFLSVFYSVSRISPPDCPYDDAEPRTRPRPLPPSSSNPTALSSISTSLATSSRSFLSFTKQRPRKNTPPQTIRLKSSEHPFHGLENVDETEEAQMESLIADEGSDDGPSEVDTVEDNLSLPTTGSRGKVKGKGMKGIFGRKQPVRQSSGSSSEFRDDAPTSSAWVEPPSTMRSTSSSSTSPTSALCDKAHKKLRCAATVSFSTPPASLIPTSSSSIPTRPPLLSSSSAPRLSVEPISLSDQSSSDSLDSLASHPTSPRSNPSKRLNPFRIFTRHRSSSPLASPLSSPFVSPVSSPPLSPILAPKMVRTGSHDSIEGRTGAGGGMMLIPGGADRKSVV